MNNTVTNNENIPKKRGRKPKPKNIDIPINLSKTN